MNDTHQLNITDTRPGKPTSYTALCGCQSEKRADFRGDRQPVETVTCQECMAKMHYGYLCDGGTNG